MAGRPREFDR
ncbi:TetR family transcriptional regulator, partial [Acinetobacter sp. V2]